SASHVSPVLVNCRPLFPKPETRVTICPLRTPVADTIEASADRERRVMRKVPEPVMVASHGSFNRLASVGDRHSSSAQSRPRNGGTRHAGLLRVASLLFWNPPARADSIEVFYAGKQIQLIISTATGGGYDAYPRAPARHIGNHLPGKPVFVPQNMPGAGGLRASGYMFNSAPRDRTAIALIHGTMVTADLLLPDSAKFAPARFSWIGNIESEAGFCAAWAESGFKTIADLKTREMIIGASGAGGESNLHPRMLMKLYGAKIRIVSGYGSSNNLALAMARREIDGRCGWTPSVFEANNLDWIRDHK